MASKAWILEEIEVGEGEEVANSLADKINSIIDALTGVLDMVIQVGGADVSIGNPLPTMDKPRVLDADLTDTSAADTDAVITLAAAGAGVSHVIRGIAWGYSEAPTGGSLTIEDGAANVVFSIPITGAGAGFVPVFGKGTANTDLIVTLAAGDGTCVGSVNVLEAWTE